MTYRAEIWRGSEFVSLCSCDMDASGIPYKVCAHCLLPDGPYEIRFGDKTVPMRFRYGMWQRRKKARFSHQ